MSMHAGSYLAIFGLVTLVWGALILVGLWKTLF
jgi:hypothetical protein